MEWTYYRETFIDGDWALFRSANRRKDEVYNPQKGWIETDLLFRRQSKGDIDAADIISEGDAKKLIEGVSGAVQAGLPRTG